MPSADEFLESIRLGLQKIEEDPGKESYRFALQEIDMIIWHIAPDPEIEDIDPGEAL